MPVLSVFAGPNGSGKSSVIRLTATFEGKENLLEPDAVAKKFTSMEPREAAIAAGREVIQLSREYIARGESFAIETTLSGNWTTLAIQRAIGRGYRIHLFFICLDRAERNLDRVRERVAQGGHDVPEMDIRRRYQRSL